MNYLIVIVFALFGFASTNRVYDRPCRFTEVSPRVKIDFQLAAYLGVWFEIERYEAANQTDFDCVEARYSLNTDGSVQVVNSGYTPGGNRIELTGRATVTFPDQTPLPAKLDISFFGGSK